METGTIRANDWTVGWARLLSHRRFLSLRICFLLLVAPVLRAQSDTDADPLPMLVSLLRGTADPELQLDILRGLSAAFKGRRQVPKPKGWEAVEAQLERSPNADVRALAQSLSLTFGSTSALVTLRNTASDRSADGSDGQSLTDGSWAIEVSHRAEQCVD